jgi:hypothetical protein
MLQHVDQKEAVTQRGVVENVSWNERFTAEMKGILES